MSEHVFAEGELLTAEKVNDNLNHTLIAPVEYTPTVGGANANATATYLRIGKRVEVEFSIMFSGAATGTVTVSTPSSMAPSASSTALGAAFGLDASVGSSSRRSFTVLGLSGLASVSFVVDSATSAGNVSASVPWTWAATDRIDGRFAYWEA